MADQSMYYAQTQGFVPGPGEDPSNPNRINQPVYHQYHQSTGIPPAGVPPPPQPGSAYYGAPPLVPNQWPGYGPPQQPGIASEPQGAYGPPQVNNTSGLASHMGSLSLGGDLGTGARSHRRRQHRHAYHDLGSISHSPSPSLPPSDFASHHRGEPSTSQFLTPGLAQTSRPVSPSISPAPSLPPQAAGPPSQGRVDPEQIPSIPRSRDVPAGYYFNHVYPTMEHHLPPPAAIPFVAYDQGNSSPKFARLTLNNIASTADFLSSTALPLGLILQPLARLDPGEQPVPVLDFGDVGPPRCRRCRTYINPFMVFRSGGNRFICNMCTFPNDVPPEYFAPLDPSGTRVDRLQRPELMMGTVEFLVPREYWNQEPVGLNQLFVIDVSQESVRRGFLGAVCKGILEALYGSGEEQETAEGETATRKVPQGSKVGIVTFDKEVQFYNLRVSFFLPFFFFFFWSDIYHSPCLIRHR